MRETTASHIVVGDIATNCWIYPLAETSAMQGLPLASGYQACALIDPGAEAQQIIARLDSLKLVPIYILLTHGHFDHIGAVPSLVVEFRTRQPHGGGNSSGSSGNIPIVAIHRADAHYLGPDSYQVHCRSFAAAAGSSEYIDALWEDMPPPDLTLEEGTDIGPFTVLHLPGHTQGSIALWDKEAKNLFTGDTLFKGDFGRTDLPEGNDEQIIASLKRLFAMDGQINVYPGHGPVTTIGQEARRGLI